MKKQAVKKLTVGICVLFSFALLHICSAAHSLAETDFTLPAAKTGEMSQGRAFDGENFLVVIRGDQSQGGRIAAQLISRAGKPVGSRIDIGRSGWIPGVAFDGENYLMIWEDGESEPANLIYGQFINKSGSLVGRPFPISTAPGFMDPACALSFNGAMYITVWNDATADGPCGNQNYRTVTKTFDGTAHIAAFNDEMAEGPCGSVLSRTVTRTGALGNETILSTAPGCYPCTTSGQGNSLVAWNSGLAGVVGRVVDSSGTPVGPAIDLSNTPVEPSIAVDSEAGAANRPSAGINPLSAVSSVSLSVSQDGLAVTLTATLLSGGSPVKGKSVSFYDQPGAGSFASKGTAITNDSGIAVKKFNSTLGQHTAYAKFNASGDMPAAQSDNVAYTIAKVMLNSPATDYVSPIPTPDLSWQACDGASQYHVQVSTSASFGAGTFLVDADTGTASLNYSIPSPGLVPGKAYYWRVWAYTTNGKSVYADKRKIMFKPAVKLVLEKVGVNGSTITFTATLTRADNGAPISGKSITFYEKTGDGSFAQKGTATTGSSTSATPGVATKPWTVKPGNHQAYALFKGDTSYASNSTDPADAIYITYPPVTFNLPSSLRAACPNVPYYESVVSDSNPVGGVGPPYHFMLGTMGGFPPMGIILDATGVLSGTPTSPPGTKAPFTVCAVDLGGNTSCKPTSILVDPDCIAAMTGTWVGTFNLAHQKVLCPPDPSGRVLVEGGPATLYLQQVGKTVTGTFSINSVGIGGSCSSTPSMLTGHVKGTITLDNPAVKEIKFTVIELSGYAFPAYTSYYVPLTPMVVGSMNDDYNLLLSVSKQ